jgi:hypothetical protein
MANHHFIVLIDQTHWRVVQMRGQVFFAMRTFEIDDGSRAELLRWWLAFPQATVSFLTNHADEHYHVEGLPHVRGAAGRQLLMRKLAAWPLSQGMHAVCRLDRVQTLRRESRFLFVACLYPPLADLLPTLQAAAIRVQGVYTHALSLACWLPAPQQNALHRLCIECTPQQVRLSYLQQQRLFFSRLILLPPDLFSTSEACVARILHEVGQIRMTLLHQQWLQQADELRITWLGMMPMEASWIKPRLPAGCAWTDLSEAVLARQLGYNAIPDGLSVVDWAAVRVVLKGGLPNLAPESVLLAGSIVRVRRRLHWAGMVMAAVMVFAGGVALRATQVAQGNLQQVRHQLSALPAAATSGVSEALLPQMRAFTQAVQSLQSSVRSPGPALAIMQQALASVVHWRVASLEWAVADQPLAQALTTPASAWQETLTITWNKVEQSGPASEEWQQLLHRLRDLSAVEKVEVLTPNVSTDAAQRQGRTGPALWPDQPPVLKVYLREPRPGAANES